MVAQSDAKVWLITGCSTGFGRSLAEAVLQGGDRVIATARNDAVNGIDQKLESMKAELDAWKEVSMNTAFEGATVGALGG